LRVIEEIHFVARREDADVHPSPATPTALCHPKAEHQGQ
jgi:hypothetical protein